MAVHAGSGMMGFFRVIPANRRNIALGDDFFRNYPAVIAAQPPPFALQIQSAADRSVELRWSSLLDATLESTNAPATGPWTPVPSPLESSGGWLSLRVPTADRGFFRLRRRAQ
jgi:hypothetical protein